LHNAAAGTTTAVGALVAAPEVTHRHQFEAAVANAVAAGVTQTPTPEDADAGPSPAPAVVAAVPGPASDGVNNPPMRMLFKKWIVHGPYVNHTYGIVMQEGPYNKRDFYVAGLTFLSTEDWSRLPTVTQQQMGTGGVVDSTCPC
jgi:hypothetical protein